MPSTAQADDRPAVPLTNGEFLIALFHGSHREAHITGFTDPPEDVEGWKWAGARAGERRVEPTDNTYFCISTFRPEGDKAVRRKANFVAGHVLVVDDVGTKVRPDDPRLPPPTWRLETSPGNYQWGYLLHEPCSDQALFSGTLALMVAKGLALDGNDPGMKGVTRYVRLPQGINRKKKYSADGSIGFVCRLHAWHPERSFTLAQLLEQFGATEDEARALGESSGTALREPAPDDRLLQALQSQGLFKRRLGDGRYDITCPWLDTHSDGRDDGTAVFTRADGSYGFECHHGHCTGRNAGHLKAWLLERGELTVPFTACTPEPQDEALWAEHEQAKGQAEAEAARALRGRALTLVDEGTAPLIAARDRYLVSHFIESRALGVVWGEPGTMKSFLALDWAMSIAEGVPWHGVPVRQCPVIYVAGEGQRGIMRRVQAWRAARGVPAGERNFRTSMGAVNAREPTFVQDILAFVEQGMPAPGLVVIDTLARNFGGGDENTAKDIGELVDVCDRQLAQVLGCTVLLVHHSGKTGEAIRGSSALKGAVDFEYEVRRKERALSIELHNHKMKDSAMLPPLRLAAQVVPLEFTEPTPVGDGAIAPLLARMQEHDKGSLAFVSLEEVDAMPVKNEKPLTPPSAEQVHVLRFIVQARRVVTLAEIKDAYRAIAPAPESGTDKRRDHAATHAHRLAGKGWITGDKDNGYAFADTPATAWARRFLSEQPISAEEFLALPEGEAEGDGANWKPEPVAPERINCMKGEVSDLFRDVQQMSAETFRALGAITLWHEQALELMAKYNLDRDALAAALNLQVVLRPGTSKWILTQYSARQITFSGEQQ